MALAVAILFAIATGTRFVAEAAGASRPLPAEGGAFAGSDIGPAGTNRWWIGAEVALHSTVHNRFLTIPNGGYVTGSHQKDWNALPSDWNWKRFRIVDIGDGDVAFHCAATNRFLRMRDNARLDASLEKSWNKFPADWTWERFRIVDAGDGEIGIYSPHHKRYVRMRDDASTDATHPYWSDMNMPPKSEWTWERFRVVMTRLPIGAEIALHSGKYNRYLKMNTDRTVQVSSEKDWERLPWDWTLERFRVVDAGNGRIALHSAKANRFLRMRDDGTIDGSGTQAWNALPSSWGWERFRVVDAGDGMIALHSDWHNRFIQIDRSLNVRTSVPTAYTDLPAGRFNERFRVVNVSPNVASGSVVALHSPAHNRFVACYPDDIVRSPEKNWDELPDVQEWPSERWRIVGNDGSGQFYLYNAFRNGFMYMSTGTTCDVRWSTTPTSSSLWRAYDANDGKIAFYNDVVRRFLIVTSSYVACSSNMEAFDLPEHANPSWARFRVVLVKPPIGAIVSFHNPATSRLVAMISDTNMGTKWHSAWSEVGWNWYEEKFRIVDGGGDLIALHNGKRNRYVRMIGGDMDTSAVMGYSELPSWSSWPSERFRVVDLGDGQVGVHSPRVSSAEQ